MRAQITNHADQEPFIRVLVLEFAPIRAAETQKRRSRKHGDEEHVVNPGKLFSHNQNDLPGRN